MMASNDPLEANAISVVGRSMGFPVTPAAADALARFGHLFLRWNDSINLASLRAPSELLDRHFRDAFAACQMVEPGEHVADVGSGGGLPAIPMAVLLPSCRFELFEPIRKKVAFLRTAVRELGIGARVTIHAFAVSQPVEPPLARAFDVASSRATLAPSVWLGMGRELARPGGKVLVFATAEAAADLPPADRALRYGENRALLVFSGTAPPVG